MMSILYLVSSLLLVQGVVAQCPSLYPKVIGGKNSNTYLYDIDYYAGTDSSVAVGATSDVSLTTYTCTNIQYEVIFFYTASVQVWNKLAYFSQNTCNSESASMVTFSTDGNYLLVYSTLQQSYQIWDTSGNLINMLQFLTNIQLASGIKTMAMVKESDSTYSLYIVRANAGITKVANVLTSPSQSTLTLTSTSLVNFGLQYDSSSQSIYTGHSSTSPQTNYFAKHQTSNFATQILAQISIGTDSYSYFQYKYQASSGVSSIISISNSFRLCLMNLTSGTYISVQPFGNWVTTATVLALVNMDNSQIYIVGTNSGSTFFGNLVINSLGSTFTVSPAYDSSLIATRVVFKPLSSNYLYVSSKNQIYYDQLQGNYRQYSFYQGIIMTSDQTQSCIVQDTAQTQSVYNVNPHYEDNIAIQINATSVFTTTTNDLVLYQAQYELNQAAVANSLSVPNAEWCDSFPSILQTVQANSALRYKQGLAASQTLTFQAFTASVTNCNSKTFPMSSYSFSATPYFAFNFQQTAQIVLPAQMAAIDYTVTVSSTIISGSGSNLVGSTVLTLRYDRPPYFLSNLAPSVTVDLNHVGTYVLPTYTDPEGDMITVVPSISGLPSYITFDLWKTYTISPVSFSQVGTINITLSISDAYNAPVIRQFQVIVTNFAPYFISGLTNQVTPINTPFLYALPTMKDDEYNLIYLTYSPSLSWISYSNGILKINPTDSNFTTVGVTAITIVLSDSVLKNSYTFLIEVTNSAPYFQPSTLVNQVTPINTALTYILPTMKDNEQNPITLTYTPAINWITYSGGVFNFSPKDTNFTSVGITTITVVLSDTQLTNTYTFKITVTNTAPFFQPSTLVNQVTPINTPLTYALPTMMDHESDPIQFSYTPLISWIVYSNGVFTFRPKDTNFSSVGTTTIKMILSDKQLSNIYSFTITVTNTAPYFQSALANQVTPINSPISYTLPSMIDNESNPITLSYSPTLSWITYSGGVFTFNPKDTPDFSCLGQKTITVSVTDSQISSKYTFTITVTDTAPYFQLSLANQTTPINTPLSYTLPAMIDNEKNPIVLTYSPLISWISYSGGVFTFSPKDTNFSSVGATKITVVLSDTQLSTSSSFFITVTNTAPYFQSALSDQTTPINTPLAYTLPKQIDNENDPIVLSYSPLKNFFSYSNGVISFNPKDTDFSCIGQILITIILSDTKYSNAYTFKITVTNTAPYFQPSILVNQVTPVNSPITYTLPMMKDNESNNIILSYAPSINWISYNGGVFTINPKDSNMTAVGTTLITVVLSDTQLLNSYTFTITVTNSAPFFQSSLVNQVIPINSPLLYTLPVQSDTENDTIYLTYSPKPSWITYANGVLTFSPKDTNFTAVGTTTITVILSDTQLSNSYTFTITVTNSAPFFQSSLANQVMPLNSHFNYTLPAQIDNEHNPITLQYSPKPAWIAYSSGILFINPTSADYSCVGTTTITIVLSDTQLTTSYTFTVTVTNSAPIFQSPLADQTTPINTPLMYTLPAQVNINNLPIILSYSPAKSFYSYSNGVIAFNPKYSDFSCVGITTISIVLSDTHLSSTYTFTINVTNSAPYYASVPLSQKILITATSGYFLPSMIDDEGNKIYNSFTIPASCNTFIKADRTLNKITLSPPSSTKAGIYTIVSQLCDGQPLCTSYNISIEVVAPMPFFTKGGPLGQKVNLNHVLVYPLPQFQDAPGVQSLSASVTSAPSYIKFDTNTYIFTIQPTLNSEIGSSTITGIISDPVVSVKFTFQVQVINTPPYFTTALTDQTCIQGQSSTYSLPTTADYENQAVTTSVQGTLPSFVTYSSGSFKFAATSQTEVKDYLITVILSDGNMQQSFPFKVTVKQGTATNQASANSTSANSASASSTNSTANSTTSTNSSIPSSAQQGSIGDNFNATQMLKSKGQMTVAGLNGTQIVIIYYTASLRIVSVSRNGQATVQVVAQQGGPQIQQQLNSSALLVKLNNQLILSFTIASLSVSDSSFILNLQYPDPTEISQGQVIICMPQLFFINRPLISSLLLP